MDIPLENILKMLSIASEKRDPYATGHEGRTAKLCEALGRAMGLSDEDLYWLVVAARLHDIGKVFGIGGSITNKPARLTEAEYLQMKYHPSLGAQILSPLGLDSRVNAAVLHHHENWDGTGYPQGLKGEEIPLFARIIRVCDTYDSIMVDRVYRKALGHEEALMVLQTYAHNFDPAILKAFLELELEGI